MVSICRYCLSSEGCVSVCLSCRTKLEIARGQVADMKKGLDIYRRRNFILKKELFSLRKYVRGLGEKP